MTTYLNPWALLLHRHFQMMSSQLLLQLLEIFISPPRHSLAFFNTEFHSIAITSVLKSSSMFFGLVFLFCFLLYDIQTCLGIANVSKACVTSRTWYTFTTIINDNITLNQDYPGHCVAPQAASTHLALSLSTPHSSLPSSKPQFKAHWVKPTCPIS